MANDLSPGRLYGLALDHSVVVGYAATVARPRSRAAGNRSHGARPDESQPDQSAKLDRDLPGVFLLRLLLVPARHLAAGLSVHRPSYDDSAGRPFRVTAISNIRCQP